MGDTTTGARRGLTSHGARTTVRLAFSPTRPRLPVEGIATLCVCRAGVTAVFGLGGKWERPCAETASRFHMPDSCASSRWNGRTFVLFKAQGEGASRGTGGYGLTCGTAGGLLSALCRWVSREYIRYGYSYARLVGEGHIHPKTLVELLELGIELVGRADPISRSGGPERQRVHWTRAARDPFGRHYYWWTSPLSSRTWAAGRVAALLKGSTQPAVDPRGLRVHFHFGRCWQSAAKPWCGPRPQVTFEACTPKDLGAAGIRSLMEGAGVDLWIVVVTDRRPTAAIVSAWGSTLFRCGHLIP